jgi:hypothetical protein
VTVEIVGTVPAIPRHVSHSQPTASPQPFLPSAGDGDVEANAGEIGGAAAWDKLPAGVENSAVQRTSSSARLLEGARLQLPHKPHSYLRAIGSRPFPAVGATPLPGQ